MSDSDGVVCRNCGQEWPRDPVLEVSCPKCNADEGQKCRRPSEHAGGFVHPHAGRDKRAMAEVDGYGRCSETPTESIEDTTEENSPSDSEPTQTKLITDGGRSDARTHQEVEIGGEEWIAAKHHDGRYRLFKDDWPLSEGVRLPGEHGRCAYCLSPNRIHDDDPSTLVCDECGSEVTITHGQRATVGEVRSRGRTCDNPLCDESVTCDPETREAYCSWDCAVMTRSGEAARILQERGER